MTRLLTFMWLSLHPLPYRLQEYLSAARGYSQVHLLSFNQWEMSVELRPRPLCEEPSEELEPLRLRVTWGHRDTFSLQVVATYSLLVSHW